MYGPSIQRGLDSKGISEARPRGLNGQSPRMRGAGSLMMRLFPELCAHEAVEPVERYPDLLLDCARHSLGCRCPAGCDSRRHDSLTVSGGLSTINC